jgi:hypothetical protein
LVKLTAHTNHVNPCLINLKIKTIKNQSIKPGPKRTATSKEKPDQRQQDNKKTPGNTPSLQPSKSKPKNRI